MARANCCVLGTAARRGGAVDSNGGYRTIRTPGVAPEVVEAVVVDELTATDGLQVRPLGHGRISVGRSYRPTWALVLAIVLLPLGGLGLLLLFVRTSEAGQVSLVASATGVLTTLPPVVPDEAVTRLEALLNGPEPLTRSVTPEHPVATSRPTGHRIDSVPFDSARPVMATQDLDAATVASVTQPTTVRPPAHGVYLRIGGAEVRVADGETVILGRSPSLDDLRPVALPRPTEDVSKTHARLQATAGGVVITDVGSTNGTVVTSPGSAPVHLVPHVPVAVHLDAVVHLGSYPVEISASDR